MSTLILQTLTGKDRQTITSKETGEQGFQKDRKGRGLNSSTLYRDENNFLLLD